MSEGAQEEPRGGSSPQTAADEQATAGQQPDVLLDVPQLKVDEIHLEVDNLHAHVSLLAEVLNLLKLQVGVDATLGKVSLDIKGVEAAVVLKVRLGNVAAIIDRVMTTIDHNPQILGNLTGGLGAAAGELGQGTGEALDEVGAGTGRAAEEVGEGTGRAAEHIGEAAGSAIQSVGGAGYTAAELAQDGKDKQQRSHPAGPQQANP